jgi:hypothetical protein
MLQRVSCERGANSKARLVMALSPQPPATQDRMQTGQAAPPANKETFHPRGEPVKQISPSSPTPSTGLRHQPYAVASGGLSIAVLVQAVGSGANLNIRVLRQTDTQ